MREIEQQLKESDAPVAEVVEGYCLAVRSALTDDGVPPLDASGVKLHQRLNLIEQSLERVAQKGVNCPASSKLKQILSQALEQTASLWSPVMVASEELHKAAQILDNSAQLTAKQVQKQFRSLLGAMTRWQFHCWYT